MAVDGSIEQDAHGLVTAWSAESEALFGWWRAEMAGTRSRQLIPGRNRAMRNVDGYLATPIDQRTLYDVVEG